MRPVRSLGRYHFNKRVPDHDNKLVHEVKGGGEERQVLRSASLGAKLPRGGYGDHSSLTLQILNEK